MAQPNQKSRWFNYYQQPSYNLPYNTPIQCREACCHTIKCPAPYRPYVQWQYMQQQENEKFLHSKMFKQSPLSYMPVSSYLEYPQIQSPMAQPDYTTECHNISRSTLNHYDNSNLQNNEPAQSNNSHSQMSRNLQKLDVRQFLATWKDDDESNETASNIIGQEINSCKCPADSYQSYQNMRNQTNCIVGPENNFRDVGLFSSENHCQPMAFHKQHVQQVDYDLPRNFDTKKRIQQPYIMPPNDCYYALQNGNYSSNFVSSYNNFKNLSNIPYSSEYRNSMTTKVNKKRLEVPYERTIEKVWNPNINNYPQYKNVEITHMENGNHGINSSLCSEISTPNYDGFKVGNEKYNFYDLESDDLFSDMSKTNQIHQKHLFQPSSNQYDYIKETTNLTEKSDTHHINTKPILHNILTGQEPIEKSCDSSVVQHSMLEPRGVTFINSKDSIKCGCSKMETCKMIPSFPDRIENYGFEQKYYETNDKKYSSTWEFTNDGLHFKKYPESVEHFSKIKNNKGGYIHNNKLNNFKKGFQEIFADGPEHSDVNLVSGVVSEKNKVDENKDFFIRNHYTQTIEPNSSSGHILIPIIKESERNILMLQNNCYSSNISGMISSDLCSDKSVMENNCSTKTQYTKNYTADDKLAEIINTTEKTIHAPNQDTKIIAKQREPVSIESQVQNNSPCIVDEKQNRIHKKEMDLCNTVNTNVDLMSKAIGIVSVDNFIDSKINKGGQNISSIIKSIMKCSEKEINGVHKTNNSLKSISFIFKDINFSKRRVETYLKLRSECIQDLFNINLAACKDILHTPLSILKTLTYNSTDMKNKKFEIINDIIKSDYLNGNNIQLSFKKKRSEANKCIVNTFMNGFNSRPLPKIKLEKCTSNNVELKSEEKKTKFNMTLAAYKRTVDPKKAPNWKRLNKAHFYNTIIKMNINKKIKYLKTFKLVKSGKKYAADKIVSKYKHLRNQFIHKRQYSNRLKSRVENTVLKPSTFADKNKTVYNVTPFLNHEYSNKNVDVKDNLVIILDGIIGDNTDLNKKQKSHTQCNWMDIHNKNDRVVLESSSDHHSYTNEDINDKVLSDANTWSYQDSNFEPKNMNIKCSSRWDQIFNLKQNQSETEENMSPAKLELLFDSDEQQEQWQIIDQCNDNGSKLLKVKRLLVRRKTVPKKRVPKVVIKKTKGQKYKSFIKEFEMQPTVMLEHCSHLDEMAVGRVHAKFICRSCYFPFNSQEALNDHHCRKEDLYCI